MKKFAIMVALILAAISVPCMAANNISVWDGVSVDADWGSNYDAESTFVIEDADDFIAFRNMVMNEFSFSEKTIKLQKDIDLDNHNLKYGVGSFTTTSNTSDNSGEWYRGLSTFKGVFNGNGHVIKNIRMNQNEDDSVLDSSVYGENKMVGLFYMRYGRIENLGLENMEVTFLNSGEISASFFGGICSSSYQGSVSNSFVRNAVFSGGDAVKSRVRLGTISGYHRAGTVENCYVDGADFSGITIGQARGAIQVGGLVYSEEAGITHVKKCYTANINMGSARLESFHDCVLTSENMSGTLVNVFSETHSSSSTGSTALLTVENDVAVSLGSAFRDMSSRKIYPILSWEIVPAMFECDNIKVLAFSGTGDEREINRLMTNNGQITVEIEGFKNNTGIDASDAVVNVSYFTGGRLKKTKSILTSIEKLKKNGSDENIIVTLDLSDVEVADGDFIQIVTYKGVDDVIPLLKVKKIEK